MSEKEYFDSDEELIYKTALKKLKKGLN